MTRLYGCLLMLITNWVLAGYDADYYSVVTLRNDTSHTIYYSYKWSETGQVRSNSIKPGKHYVHYWIFDYANQNYAPPFYVRLEDDSLDSWYALKSYFAPDIQAHRGRLFRFKTRLEDMTLTN